MIAARALRASLVLSLALLAACQSFQPTTESQLAPETWVRVTSAQPFVVQLRSAADETDLVACQVTRLEGRFSAASGDTLTFGRIAGVRFAASPDSRCAVRTSGLIVRSPDNVFVVGIRGFAVPETSFVLMASALAFYVLFFIVIAPDLG